MSVQVLCSISILFSAVFHHEGCKDKRKEPEGKILELWLDYCYRGIESGELKRDTDPQLVVPSSLPLHCRDAFSLSTVRGEGEIKI